MTLQFLTILGAAGALGMLALTHNAAAEYFMFSVLVAVLVVSYASSRLSTRALRLRRDTTDRVFEGEALRVTLEVANQGRFPRFLLDVQDTLPPFLESDDGRDFMVPTLWPGERVTLTYTARPHKRGVYAWNPAHVSASDPFGIFQRFVPFEAPCEAVVYPRPIDLNGSLGRTGIETRGMSTGERARGSESGLDFYGIRDYQPGDELRRIHWPATAHHGRLTVIEFDRGASENVAVVLDTRAGTEYGAGLDTTLEVGVRAAASLIHWALASEGTGFLAVSESDGPRWLTVERAHREFEALEVLARVQAEGTMSASALLEWASRHIQPEANVVLITAAPDEGLPAAVEGLRRRYLRVAAIIFDGHSFDATVPPTGHLEQRLAAAGASVISLRRGSDLKQGLQRVLTGES
jgi:uncharacterized protein (DUF58 family)